MSAAPAVALGSAGRIVLPLSFQTQQNAPLIRGTAWASHFRNRVPEPLPPLLPPGPDLYSSHPGAVRSSTLALLITDRAQDNGRR